MPVFYISAENFGSETHKSPIPFAIFTWVLILYWHFYQSIALLLLNDLDLVEKDDWAMKPMNCPSHCLIFGARQRSYKAGLNRTHILFHTELLRKMRKKSIVKIMLHSTNLFCNQFDSSSPLKLFVLKCGDQAN